MYRFTLFIIILLVFISCSSNIFFWDGRDPAFENDSKYVGLWSDSGKNLVCLILIPHDVGYAFTSDFKSKLEMDLNTSISSFQITLLGVNEKPNKIYFTKKGLFFNDEQIKTDSLTRVFVLTKNSNLIPINLTYQELNYFQFDSLEYLDNKYIWTEKIKNQLEKDEFKFQMTAKIRNTLEGIKDQINLSVLFYYNTNLNKDKFIAAFAERITGREKLNNLDINFIEDKYPPKRLKDRYIYLYAVIGVFHNHKWHHRIVSKTLVRNYGQISTLRLKYINDMKNISPSFWKSNYFSEENIGKILKGNDL